VKKVVSNANNNNEFLEPNAVAIVRNNGTRKRQKKKKRVTKTFLRFEIGGCPLFVFLGQVSLDPGNGDGGPDTGPEEGHDPADLPSISTRVKMWDRTDTYNISCVALDSEDNNSSGNGACNGANGPEKSLAVQHLTESLAGLVSQVQPLAELRASRSVNSANVLDVCVDSRAERRALGQRRDTAGCGNLHDAENIDYDELHTNGEQHGRRRHREHTDGWVVGTGAATMSLAWVAVKGEEKNVRNQFDHNKEPSNGEVPVEPIELSIISRCPCDIRWNTHIVSLRSNDPAVGVLAPQADEADKVLDNGDGSEQRGTDTEDGVRGELVARQAIPHAKVHSNGHEDAVDEDERPEPSDGLPARAQRVLERRRLPEVGVIVRDLCVRVYGVRVGRYCAAWLGAECRRGLGSWLALVVVARAVDLEPGDLE
jgi:hypothetical protein